MALYANLKNAATVFCKRTERCDEGKLVLLGHTNLSCVSVPPVAKTVAIPQNVKMRFFYTVLTHSHTLSHINVHTLWHLCVFLLTV